MKLSIVIPTYDDLPALRLVLRAIQREPNPESRETIVVSDGDADFQALHATVVEHGGICLPLPAADSEFRAGWARNLGIAHARAGRILFLDQDCVPRPGVIASHAAYGTEALMVAGARTDLTEHASNLCRAGRCTVAEAAVTGWRDGRYSISSGPPFGDTPDRLRAGETVFETKAIRMARTCHLSVPTDAIRAIDGFYEGFVGWGGEDVEMALRLQRSGVRLLLNFDLQVDHLWHPTRSVQMAHYNYKVRQGASSPLRRNPENKTAFRG